MFQVKVVGYAGWNARRGDVANKSLSFSGGQPIPGALRCELVLRLEMCYKQGCCGFCGVAGLAPASLKLCNSFVRPQITVTAEREQLRAHLQAGLPSCPQVIIFENIVHNFHECLIGS